MYKWLFFTINFEGGENLHDFRVWCLVEKIGAKATDDGWFYSLGVRGVQTCSQKTSCDTVPSCQQNICNLETEPP